MTKSGSVGGVRRREAGGVMRRERKGGSCGGPAWLSARKAWVVDWSWWHRDVVDLAQRVSEVNSLSVCPSPQD